VEPQAFAEAGEFRFHGFDADPVFLGEFLLRPAVDVMPADQGAVSCAESMHRVLKFSASIAASGFAARLLPLLEAFIEPAPAAFPARVVDDLAADKAGQPCHEGLFVMDDFRVPQDAQINALHDVREVAFGRAAGTGEVHELRIKAFVERAPGVFVAA